MYKIFELTSKYISTRRKAGTITLSSIELECHIQKTIFLMEMRGDKYFNYSKVLNELVETQGFPDRKNNKELTVYRECFYKVAGQYEMFPSHLNNYSFKLKAKPSQPLFTFKRLIP